MPDVPESALSASSARCFSATVVAGPSPAVFDGISLAEYKETIACTSVREVFTAKPGSASKLARLFKDGLANMPELNTRVMTDYIGPFNTVVLVSEVENLDLFHKSLDDYMARPDIREKFQGYTDLYLTGRREVYKLL